MARVCPCELLVMCAAHGAGGDWGVKLNAEKFSEDFAFQLTPQDVSDIRPQIVTASNKRNVRFRPYAFTEHGAIMAATVLNSPQAVQMRVFVDIITPSELPDPLKKPIGFGVRERHVGCRVAGAKRRWTAVSKDE